MAKKKVLVTGMSGRIGGAILRHLGDKYDEVDRVREKRQQLEERLRRLGRAYVDELYADGDYHREKRYIEMESLAVPEVDAATKAGRLIEDLPRLWAEANLEERRKLLLTMLDAVYVDTKESRPIVAIKPKPAFAPIFQVAVAREGSGVVLLKEEGLPLSLPEPSEAGPSTPCSWWRRGWSQSLPETRTCRLDHAGVESCVSTCGLWPQQSLSPQPLCAIPQPLVVYDGGV
ncbi:hypothetical protein ACFLX9_02615 [Chloroflexota bacterium]